MKTTIRITLAIILVLLSTVRVEPKPSTTIYTPLLVSGHKEEHMSNWKLIVPEATTNLITNPSFETNTTSWTNTGLATFEQSSAQAKFGAYSLHMVANSQNDRASYSASGLTVAGTYTLAAWVLASVSDVQLRLASSPSGDLIGSASHTGGGAWELLTVTGALTGGESAATVQIRDNGTGGFTDFYIDAVQLEEKSNATTYCDGDQAGCEWNGAAHASASQRSAQSRAGGIVYDLLTQYGFNVERQIGIGAPVQGLLRSEYETQPGGQTDGIKITSRAFSLSGTLFPTTDLADLHAQRQALFDVLDPDKVPRADGRPQPVILRYTAAAVTKEIAAQYEGGLEANQGASGGEGNEKFALRFLADDPFWHGIGQSAAVLDSEDALTLRYLGVRLKSTGQWSDLGLSANPTTNGRIFAVLVASDKTVYYGGDFTGFDGNAGWDYLVSYTPSTDTWARIDGASEFNGIVYALAEGPDGVIYVGGAFTNAGDANGDYIATFTPSTNTVASLAAGGTGTVYTLAFDNNGLLYIGGAFAIWNGVNESEGIVTWSGAAYAAVANGFGNTVYAIAVASDNTVYATGAFTTDWDGSNPFLRFASWNGTIWTQAGSGLGGTGHALAILPNDLVTVGGAFTNAGSIANADFIAQWNGTAFFAMGTGANSTVLSVFVAPDNDIYASGVFTSIGGVATNLGKWNGSSWAAADLGIFGAVSIDGAAFGVADPVINHNFDHWIGFNATGALTAAGAATVTNVGTAPAYPKLVITRAGGTSAFIISLRNETTGHELSFNNYALLDGESLTVDLSTRKKSVTSSFYGNRQDAILKGSDTGIWYLQSGNNNITCFVYTVGGPTITAYLLWSDAYKAAD